VFPTEFNSLLALKNQSLPFQLTQTSQRHYFTPYSLQFSIHSLEISNSLLLFRRFQPATAPAEEKTTSTQQKRQVQTCLFKRF
jgi:hypothetical protein